MGHHSNIVNPRSILIVEDLPDTSNWLVRIAGEVFPDAGIATAETLKLARQAVKDRKPDLLLLDLGMPDGSGIDLIRELRKDNAEHPYIVVTTIFDDDEHLRSALRLGANGYLLKDDNESDMINNLRSLTSGRPPLSTRSLNKLVLELQPEEPEQAQLTAREEEVLVLVAKGYSVTEAADMLNLTSNTVKGYLKTIYSKLDISSRAEATSEAIKRKLIQP